MNAEIVCLFELDLQKGPQDLVVFGSESIPSELLKNAITDSECIQVTRQSSTKQVILSASTCISNSCYTRNTFVFGLIFLISWEQVAFMEKHKQILQKALFILKQLELSDKIISTKPISNETCRLIKDLYLMHSNEWISIDFATPKQMQSTEELAQPFWINEMNFADFVPTWLGKVKQTNPTMTSCVIFETLVGEIDGNQTCKEIYQSKCEKAPLWLFFTLLSYLEHWDFVEMEPKNGIATCYSLNENEYRQKLNNKQKEMLQKHCALFDGKLPIGNAFVQNWNELKELVKELFALNALKVVK